MTKVDPNDLHDRIDILYHATSEFVERAPVSSINIEAEEFIDEDGKERFCVHFGGGELSRTEELQAKTTITDIVSRLANLKDPLKNAVKSAGGNSQLVEDHINASIYLSVVIDLNNAEKHGYPLQRHKRSGIDPRIENVRKELALPLIPGRFTNPLVDGIVVFEADILDLGGQLAHDFRDLVENAISDWEDFCILHLASDSAAIISRRDKLAKQEEWELEHFARGEKVKRLLDDDNAWFDIAGSEVIPRMFVRAKGFQENAMTIMGFPTEPIEVSGSKQTIAIFDVDMGNRTRLGKETNAWQVLVVEKQEDLKLVNEYYWEMFNRPTF